MLLSMFLLHEESTMHSFWSCPNHGRTFYGWFCWSKLSISTDHGGNGCKRLTAFAALFKTFINLYLITTVLVNIWVCFQLIRICVMSARMQPMLKNATVGRKEKLAEAWKILAWKRTIRPPVEKQKSSEAAAKSQRVRILRGSAKAEWKSNRMTFTLIR